MSQFNSVAASFERLRACRQLFAVVLAIAAAMAPVSTHGDPIPGEPDISFNASGVIGQLDVGAGSDAAQFVLVQPDGKYTVGGACANGANANFCLVRVNADGSLDTAFDGPSGTGNGKFLIAIGSGGDTGTVGTLQPDGKIVMGGSCFDGVNFRFCALRVNGNGTLDTTFVGPAGNGGGKFFLPTIGSAGDDVPNAILLQPDGRIVLAGRCSVGGGTRICAMRLNADGSLDSAFNGPAGNGAGKFLFQIGANAEVATSLALQPDGKILIGGYCDGASQRDFCIARLNRSGSFDTLFVGPSGSANGRFIYTVGAGNDEARSIALQPDGKIVQAGTCFNPTTPQFCVVRHNEDGTLDTTFTGPGNSTTGKVVLPLFSSETENIATSMTLQTDGKLILGGRCMFSTSYFGCFKRLHGDGLLDTTFDGTVGGNGHSRIGVGPANDFIYSTVVQSDGKIVAAGFCDNGLVNAFCMVRMQGGPFGARQCSFDLDGDNQILPTTDMLVATRVALGLRGTAVTTGITFPANATRSSWASIRDYLVSQCGMNLN